METDTWTVTASSGEYEVLGENAGHAYLPFTERHPDDFVQSIVIKVEQLVTEVE